MSYLRLEKDADGIVELIFDQEGKDVNVMGVEYEAAMRDAIAELEAMKKELAGVYVRSGKPGQFFAGGDITAMLEMDLNASAAEKAEMLEGIMQTKALLRRLETLGVPVACGINGPALGGGFEIALACHHRLALNTVRVGLPEAGQPGGPVHQRGCPAARLHRPQFFSPVLQEMDGPDPR